MYNARRSAAGGQGGRQASGQIDWVQRQRRSGVVVTPWQSDPHSLISKARADNLAPYVQRREFPEGQVPHPSASQRWTGGATASAGCPTSAALVVAPLPPCPSSAAAADSTSILCLPCISLPRGAPHRGLRRRRGSGGRASATGVPACRCFTHRTDTPLQLMLPGVEVAWSVCGVAGKAPPTANALFDPPAALIKLMGAI